MKDWSTDKIIAVGLMTAFVVTVVAMDVVAVMHGDMGVENIAKELAIGLFSYMSRGLTSNFSQQSQTAQTLGKVSEAASHGQAIVNAVDGIKDTLKK